MTQRTSRLEDRLARVQSPRSDAIRAVNHLLPNGEQRSDERQATSLTGFISFRDHPAPIPCRILDRSYAGARLKLLNDQRHELSANDLPGRVYLRVAGNDTEVECQVRWRMDDEFGLRLVIGCFDEKLELRPAAAGV